MQIRSLRKAFRQVVAVEGVTFKAFRGQITALLGHNGAGKTTILSMITGMLDSTSGTALVNGLDIKTSMGEIRKNLGLCPQHNMLFPSLTVEEHLQFFAKVTIVFTFA